jgi:hypothetical protein
MIFLIDYDRKEGRIVQLKSYQDFDRTRAEQARLDLELLLREAAKDHEVVILEARDESALRKTHRRYFEDLDGLAKAAS